MSPAPTIKELLDEAIALLDAYRAHNPGTAAREFALAITHLEDAQMRATRGIAMTLDKFNPADPEK